MALGHCGACTVPHVEYGSTWSPIGLHGTPKRTTPTPSKDCSIRVLGMCYVLMSQGGGALQSVLDTMPDFDVKLPQYVIQNINNML